MNRVEAVNQYSYALKRGRKTYHSCILQGRYPYPQVLDEILSDSMAAGQVDLGISEIPLDQIVGTKTSGRRSSFSSDFMPLLDIDTEFASKWVELCQAHMDEGIRDPIRCFEYLGRFYVQEGNKRVSVLKSYDAATISAYIIRIVPNWTEEPEIQLYYEFMQDYQLTGLYRVRFSQRGSFAKLQAALGFEPDHVWTDDDRKNFLSGFTFFMAPFQKLGGDSLPITPADALLVWLKVYTFEDLRTLPAPQILKMLRAIWPDIKGLTEPAQISVTTETQQNVEDGFFSRLFSKITTGRLNVAFISNYFPEESDWARAHDLGRQYLETVMEDQVTVQCFNGIQPGTQADDAIEEAVKKGAQVIITTTPPLIGACRKAAAKYPDLRILNCSIFMPYSGVRTYYSRIYEGKFITGALAGIMSRDGRIGYVASNPIFGVPASINAFALGAQLTNPNAHIYLRWSCVEEKPMETLAAEGVRLISNRDIPTPDRLREPWGLCQVKDGGFTSLASPYWHWGNVYVRLVRSILNGSWDALGTSQGKAVNYWWGMHSRAIDILLGETLPAGVSQMAEILRKGVIEGSIMPFARPIRDQKGVLRSDGNQPFSPEEILQMDWLHASVEGSIPSYEELLPMAQPIVRLQGLYRDQIPPEKEGTIL